MQQASLNKREIVLTVLVMILMAGFVASIYAKKQDIKEYTEAYNECIGKLSLCMNDNNLEDYYITANGQIISNQSINFFE